MQSVWLATPSSSQYKIVDVTGRIDFKHDDAAPMGHAPNGPAAIVAAVALATEKNRRIASICRINMDILLVVD